MQKIVILFVIIQTITSCKIQIESGLSNSSEFINSDENSTQIYQSRSTSNILHPFNCASTDYGRLLFINIDDHPDIKTMELVVQENGNGSFVIIYYKNGRVDCYPNNALTVDKKYLKPNNDWTVMPTNNFDFSYTSNNGGLQASFDITIKNNQHISVSIENQTALEKHNFLAAIGAELSEVKRFPLVYLEQGGFLPVESTNFDIQIDGKAYPLKKIPLEVNGIKSYKTVYSLHPQSFFCNEERSSSLPYGKFNGQKSDTNNGIKYNYNNNNGYCETKKVEYQLSDRKMSIAFSPALPDFVSLKKGATTEGKFCIDVNNNHCIVGGSYSVERINDKITFRMNPEKGWQPMPKKPWVSYYDYQASFDISNKANYHIESIWDINK